MSLDQIVSGWSPRDYDGILVDRMPPVVASAFTPQPQYRHTLFPGFELPPGAAGVSTLVGPASEACAACPRIGDVVEIATPQGFAYAQFTDHIPLHGELLRILPGLYATRPTDLAALVQQRERYVTFSMLRGLLRHDLATVVGHFPIPARNRPIPLFRAIAGPGRHPVTGKINCWWLWDEQRRWQVEGAHGGATGPAGGVGSPS